MPSEAECGALLVHAHGTTRCDLTASHDEHEGLCESCLADEYADIEDAVLTWTGGRRTDWLSTKFGSS